MLTLKQKQIVNKYINGFTQDKAALSIYPFRYELREVWDQNNTDSTKIFVFEASIISPIKTIRFSKRVIHRFIVSTKFNEVKCVMYNRPYFKNTYLQNKVTITGSFNEKKEFVISTLNQKKLAESTGLFPIYSLKKGVNQYQIRTIIKKVLKENRHLISEMVPSFLRSKYQLLSSEQALSEIHNPQSQEQLIAALRTLKYSEALHYQVAIELVHLQNEMILKAPRTLNNFNLENELIKLPFKLSDDQYQATREILEDLKSNKPTRRLLLGDVGSGKTVVAFLVSKAMLSLGYQVAFLCPSEVLATQHSQTFSELGLSSLLLTSYTKSDALLANIKNESAQVIIGTHALFSSDVIYNNLGFVIIDEQQRFGVSQRQEMINKGQDVDVLMMSATPIPRTLASTLYAHLSISLIETMPVGRKKVITKLIEQNSIVSILDEILDFVKNKHQQIYIICAAIDDEELRNVKRVTQNLKRFLKDQLRIGSLHSKMKSDEIFKTVEAFRKNEIDILVSTTIVEVGVHVDNANMMIIYDGDRFGLSQLHQLRGRIGRGNHQGYCYVLSDSENPESLQRLNVFVNESSGFKLSELDLQMRGTGDLLGQRQSGFPHFSHLDLANDLKILEIARKDAKSLVDNPEKEATMFIDTIKKRRDRILNQVTI